MLRFLVLGEVPGTDIYLSFDQAMMLLGGFYVLLLGLHELRYTRPKAPTLEEISL